MLPTPTEAERQDPLVRRFARQLAGAPGATAVVTRRGRVTRSQLWELSERLGSLLRGQQVSPGRIVALAAVNGAGFLAALLALRRLRAAALLVDSTMPERARRVTARELGACGLLSVDHPLPALDGFRYQHLAGGGARLDPSVAVLKLTSGSSGRPAAILTPSRCLVADDAALAASMRLRDDERIVAAVPMSHSYGLSSIAVPVLSRGSTVLVADAPDPFALMRVLRDLQPTVLPTAPPYLEALMRHSRPPELPSSLRLVLSAGSPLAPANARRFRETFGQPAHVFYGASECGGITYDHEGTAAERGTVGTPVEGVRIEIGDGACRETEDRLVVRSPAVALGYHPHPSSRLDGERFVTDDLARWRDSGEVELRGRTGDLVKVRGRNVNPREIERMLSEIPGVAEVAVRGLTDSAGSELVLWAWVTADESVSTAALREQCRERLAPHEVPRRFRRVTRLPRTARGKLDLGALTEMAGDGKSR